MTSAPTPLPRPAPNAHRPPTASPGAEAGFSLIELAIILSVAAIIAAGSLSWLSPTNTDYTAKLRLTEHRMKVVRDAIVQFRLLNDRLPCASNNTLAASAANNAESCTTPAGENIGAVPTTTLGLPPEYQLDGWGRRFTYHLSGRLCPRGGGCTAATYRTPPNANSQLAPVMTNFEDTANAALRGVRLTVRFGEGGFHPDDYVAFVLISHGPDGNGARTPAGTLVTATTPGEREKYNVPTDPAISIPIRALLPTRAAFTGGTPLTNDFANYWVGPTHGRIDGVAGSEFNDIGIFMQKRHIEALVKDDMNAPVSFNECLTVAQGLQNYNSGQYAAVPGTIAEFGGGTIDRRLVVTELLWTAMQVCRYYFPASEAQLFLCPTGSAVRISSANSPVTNQNIYNAVVNTPPGTDPQQRLFSVPSMFDGSTTDGTLIPIGGVSACQ